MNAPLRSQERREVVAAARSYRLKGYKVTKADSREPRPDFLGDFVPDLIAQRDDDKVVIEVKRATTIRGSNDIVELAERVSAQPGWRFELIAVPTTTTIKMPDLNASSEEIRRLVDKGFLRPAFVVGCAMIENLLAAAAVRNDTNPANLPFPALVRDLTVQGVIDEDARRKINDAQVMRNALMRGNDAPAPTQNDVEALMKLGYELQRDVLAVEA